MKRLAISDVVFALFCFAAYNANAHHRHTKEYDDDYEKYQQRYAASEIKRDWNRLKSQCIAESNLDPMAVLEVCPELNPLFFHSAFRDGLTGGGWRNESQAS